VCDLPRESVRTMPDDNYQIDDLQRKFRAMEATRRRGNGKTGIDNPENTVRMQRQQIDKLKKDNDRLKEDLALETRQAKQANNMSAAAQIAKLQDQGDVYFRKIEQEKRRIEELDKQISLMHDQILSQRDKMGGINAARENNQQVQKKIRILENRLDKALVKFNEALAHNKSLRQEIDNLRRERVVFDGIYKRLEKELHEKKLKMAQIIEIANAAAQARDSAQNEMVQLKQQADKEQQHFEVEWSQLGRLIEKDRQMKDFMQANERVPGEGYTDTNDDPALEEEQKLKKRVTKSAWGIATDKANIHLAMEKVQAYEEAFAKIQKATKITDIDELVATFIGAEDQNFQLFNYVNDVSAEIERLEENIGKIRGEIDQYKGKGIEGDNQRKKILGDLRTKLSKTEGKATQYEDQYTEAMKTVNALKTGIESIFTAIGCKDQGMLGNAGVTEGNMMQYLGIIEERTNHLLQIYSEQVMAHEPVKEVSVFDEPEELTIDHAALAEVEADEDEADEGIAFGDDVREEVAADVAAQEGDGEAVLE
jgi:chromosome segregation ATPase